MMALAPLSLTASNTVVRRGFRIFDDNTTKSNVDRLGAGLQKLLKLLSWRVGSGRLEHEAGHVDICRPIFWLRDKRWGPAVSIGYLQGLSNEKALQSGERVPGLVFFANR